VYSSSQGSHIATGTHMRHEITQCYLPPGRGDILAFSRALDGARILPSPCREGHFCGDILGHSRRSIYSKWQGSSERRCDLLAPLPWLLVSPDAAWIVSSLNVDCPASFSAADRTSRMCRCRSLQCSRITIHKNLVVSFIVRSIATIIMFEPLVTGRQHSYRNIVRRCF